MKEFYNLDCGMTSDLLLMLNICSALLQDKKKRSKMKALIVAMPSCKQNTLGHWGNHSIT